MSDGNNFSIGAEGIDTAAIVAGIQATVDANVKKGAYNDARITRAEKSSLLHMKNNQEFLDYYLNCISRATNVDIRAFEIPRAPGLKGTLKHKLQKGVWGLLKFYTYRMWTQQNQVNSLLSTGVTMIRDKNEGSIGDLRDRVRALEKALENANIEIPKIKSEDDDDDEGGEA